MCDAAERPDLTGLDTEKLKNLITSYKQPAFRAKQLFKWIHQKRCFSFEEMSDLPKDLRKILSENTVLALPQICITRKSKKDDTTKYLLGMRDGSRVEAVLMKYSYGYSLCISSQVGCDMGCKFCASAIGGRVRNLTTAELLGQVYSIEATLEPDMRISRIVVMGTGEPLLNYDNLLDFLKIITDEQGANLSMRHITVSTCGIVSGINRLADEGLPITLALSLHAPDQKLRETLMPIAKSCPLDTVMSACDEYFKKTGRRITYEYALINGINDGPEQINALSKLLSKRQAHINLIPLNAVSELGLSPPPPEKVRQFAEGLAKSKINVTIRRSLGSDIDGACGQLRRKENL